ncbi:multidrug transporter [Phenylobacterium sp. Root77]|jgi:drug/metabolite transporter (DMT)-like permease|uniref:DMT family transporter n=1 Tax=unclassified Phenylobacterium TaxID=2640670 RepID=UPI0006F242BA|nr:MULTISPECIES: DMT family transporter [unclassified Phenylobacterium]KQW72155.1 multidrug transporter [Phenylobacterium sp. Root1277]KQW95075.1 multidrug transporter [Phenylobacterium sp. Root1290]KRC44768.1 multidrug transporter [Phenylobacterium sp. Root77]
MLWIILTAAAAPLQVARNALQRGLVGDAGPWGATLVRFLFGLPFALLIFGAVALATPDADPRFSWRFALAVASGAAGQVAATAALLVAMRRSGFAVATFMQQSSLPLAALMGVVVGDRLSLHAWLGVAATTAGLAVLSWPKAGADKGAARGALFGLASGLAFGVTLNAYRQAGLALDPAHPIYAATASVCIAQALQSSALLAFLGMTRPAALRAVFASWRQSLGAGFCGAAASACWFAALALAPAGAVRAVGVIEAPIAAAAGRRLFKEKLSLRQMIGGAATAIGVVMTALW